MELSKQLAILDKLDFAERRRKLGTLNEKEREELETHWKLWARPEQLPPDGDWRTWLVMAGRGFGKTRAGAEWVRALADAEPDARIALVGATLPEVRAVMVEGESGLLSICPPRRRPAFEPSLRRITWPNGAQASLYSAGEPESLRGPQHSHAWCDEIGKWDNASERAMQAWDNLLMGLRLGERPQVLATTTPRAVPLVRRLFAEEAEGSVAVTRGRTYDNGANLPMRFLEAMRSQFGSTALGRRRKSSTSTKRMPVPTCCCTPRSRAKRARPLPHRWKASAGWSGLPLPATGPATMANLLACNRATGCSPPRVTAWWCSTARSARCAVMTAAGRSRQR